MKKKYHRITFIWAYCVLCFQGIALGQNYCTDFETIFETNWRTISAFVTSSSPGPSEQSDDTFLETLDGSGGSWLFNRVDYKGDWTTEFVGNQICWDFKIINDGDRAVDLIPTISLFQGSPFSPTISATYTSVLSVNIETGWTHVCAPIAICIDEELPSDEMGFWTMDKEWGCEDWDILITDVTGIRFDIELIVNHVVEAYGFDNICFENKEVDTLAVKEITNREIYTPNIFSPNQDGVNDYFYLQTGPQAKVQFLRIYNRWGALVFDQAKDQPTNDPLVGWNGKLRGKALNNGVYIWIAEVLFEDGVIQKVNGDVMVMK